MATRCESDGSKEKLEEIIATQSKITQPGHFRIRSSDQIRSEIYQNDDACYSRYIQPNCDECCMRTCWCWVPCLFGGCEMAQMQRELRVRGFLRHPTFLVWIAEVLCCVETSSKLQFEAAKVCARLEIGHEQSEWWAWKEKYAAREAHYKPQLQGGMLTITLDVTTITLRDSLYLSSFVHHLQSWRWVEHGTAQERGIRSQPLKGTTWRFSTHE